MPLSYDASTFVMPKNTCILTSSILLGGFALAQFSGAMTVTVSGVAEKDVVQSMVNQLSLEKYKATIKGLTKFGDRRQGTQRNRDALDWIEAELKSYGYTNTERHQYEFPAKRILPRGRQVLQPGYAVGGGRQRGWKAPTGVTRNPKAQKDARLRKLNTPPAKPGLREQVYCTKIGTTRPHEMYMVGAHMDGIGWGEAANDDGSGTALVMELARIFANPKIQTECSIRFVLWNNEESGLNGSRAYVQDRAALQGVENPSGSGIFPEPHWLGMIQHDMMLFDHGMPRKDGTLNPEQRPEADVNIEFQMDSKFSLQSQKLAWAFQKSNERYATDYPATVGSHMTNTDSASFMDHVPSISLRENERGTQVGNGWSPHWHQPSDLYSTYSDKDFRLGLNAAQTTLAAVAKLADAKF